MEVAGDASSWAGFLSLDHFVRCVLEEIDRAWPSVIRPAPDSHEDPITAKLFYHIKSHARARRLPFRIALQPHDVRGDGSLIKPDLIFETNATQWDDQFVYIECKRLRYLSTDDSCTSGNSAYVDGQNQGMLAFVTERYDAPLGHGGMIGYILCDSKKARASVESSLGRLIKKRKIELNLTQDFELSTLCSGANCRIFETHHVSSSSGRVIRIHHILLHHENCDGGG